MSERIKIIQDGHDGAEIPATSPLNTPPLNYREAQQRHPAFNRVADDNPGPRKLFVAEYVADVVAGQLSGGESQPAEPPRDYDGAEHLGAMLRDIWTYAPYTTGSEQAPSSAPRATDGACIIPFPHLESPTSMPDPPSGSAA